MNDKLLQNDRLRFQLELEFIEMLANPWYIQYLSQSRYFEDDKFINYLQYLRYWQQPNYAKYIHHVHSLYFLELLQDERFRERMKNDPSYVDLVHSNQFFHWKFSRLNRYNQKVQNEQQQQ